MTLRLAHLSDIHFGGEDAQACAAALERVVLFAPHLVVVTGDLTLNGLPREFEAARRWIDQLPNPKLVTPGNHDTPYWNLALRTITPFDRYRRYIGTPEHAEFEGSGLSAFALNSARGAQFRPNWAKGAIDLHRLDGVAEQISRSSSGLRVFVCHHPLIDLVGAPVTGGVRRGAIAARRLGEAGADLILTGHVHNPFALSMASEGERMFAVGAGTLSLRTRGSPAGFSLIEADDELCEVTALGWSGTRFETYRVWPLVRRSASTQGSQREFNASR